MHPGAARTARRGCRPGGGPPEGPFGTRRVPGGDARALLLHGAHGPVHRGDHRGGDLAGLRRLSGSAPASRRARPPKAARRRHLGGDGRPRRRLPRAAPGVLLGLHAPAAVRHPQARDVPRRTHRDEGRRVPLDHGSGRPALCPSASRLGRRGDGGLRDGLGRRPCADGAAWRPRRPQTRAGAGRLPVAGSRRREALPGRSGAGDLRSCGSWRSGGRPPGSTGRDGAHGSPRARGRCRPRTGSRSPGEGRPHDRSGRRRRKARCRATPCRAGR